MRVGESTDVAGTPRTRALAAALRRARVDAGWAVREVARRLDLSHTTISQWETGKRVPQVEDVSAVLATIGVTGETRKQILDLARGAAEPDWLAHHSAVMMAGIVECERNATEIVEWSPMVVSGVLQTADYARAILGARAGLSPAEVETRIQQRLGRLEVITGHREGRGPAAYTPVLGEWAVRQRVGGASVFTAQLDYLLDIATRLPLRIVPIGDGWHPGLVGPFTIFTFLDQPSIVLAEHHRSSLFLYNDQVSTDYKTAATQLLDSALSRDDSLELIREIRRRE